MKWINLETAQLRAPEFIGSRPAERATWLCVLAYACELECSGVLVGAALWKDRQWQQACGVTLREVLAADKLLLVNGDDVVVWAYPLESEQLLRKKRCGGGDGARRRWNGRDGSPNGSPISSPNGLPIGCPDGSANWKGKEIKDNHPPLPPRAAETVREGQGNGGESRGGCGGDVDAEGLPAVLWLVEYAVRIGFVGFGPDAAEQFRDHYRVTGKLPADWEATVRQWMRRNKGVWKGIDGSGVPAALSGPGMNALKAGQRVVLFQDAAKRTGKEGEGRLIAQSPEGMPPDGCENWWVELNGVKVKRTVNRLDVIAA